jgi:hypothetical protein
MVDTASFTKMVPGFDFLQSLVKNAGSALPSISQWVAPTLDPDELEKRIEQLRTVQYWLEQNSRMLGATIQALEVQRMTLSTLKTMNVQMTDLRDSLTIKSPFMTGASASPSTAKASPASAEPSPAPAAEPSQPPAANKKPAKAKGAAAAAPTSLFSTIDPTQAWSALLQQFGQIAASAMKDTAGDATKAMAGAMVKQGMDAAGKTFEQAVSAPGKAAAKVAGVASGMASSVANSAAKAVERAAGQAAGRLTRAAGGAPVDAPAKPAARKPAAKKKPGR